ncbi:hypothetical protein C5B85_08840 [Pseudoclavibacter sp. AY1F1]|uniref:hypothetical protein n=1 Tax=Pseudoclavibacter sp. AY1F1 TaxID=2080583 RepID=UPI000CE7DCFF|nr:hypothetical protein [Pseudoclavibacter sp. AY1F1]PPF44838.1 hypothetical protein C5B85_08840 [Pseudoclavibacter sp. AY1F1]
MIGMALGVLVQGIDAVTSNKMALELEFNHAWRSWPQARHNDEAKANASKPGATDTPELKQSK